MTVQKSRRFYDHLASAQETIFFLKSTIFSFHLLVWTFKGPFFAASRNATLKHLPREVNYLEDQEFLGMTFC